MKTIRLRVRLRDVEPEVVRILDVPAKALLPEVHALLQAAIGWTDSHLHEFITDDAHYGPPAFEGPDDLHDEQRVELKKLPARFIYVYDFGDDWLHDVDVLGAGADVPGCVEAVGACPPEDCGGPPGYAHLLDVLADPAHDEHDDLRSWAGDWRPEVDLEKLDMLVRRTAGEVPASVRLVLDLAADGVRLTRGGRLPRSFVRDVQQHYPRWAFYYERPASREEDLIPLAALHDVLRDTGLLRLRKGVLSPIRAADDDAEAIRRLRSWFGPAAGFTALLADFAVAVVATADGPVPRSKLSAAVFELVGPRWVTGDGQPITERHVSMDIARLSSVLIGLDLIDDRGKEGWAPGPSARTLLPRATALAHQWSSVGRPY